MRPPKHNVATRHRPTMFAVATRIALWTRVVRTAISSKTARVAHGKCAVPMSIRFRSRPKLWTEFVCPKHALVATGHLRPVLLAQIMTRRHAVRVPQGLFSLWKLHCAGQVARVMLPTSWRRRTSARPALTTALTDTIVSVADRTPRMTTRASVFRAIHRGRTPTTSPGAITATLLRAQRRAIRAFTRSMARAL